MRLADKAYFVFLIAGQLVLLISSLTLALEFSKLIGRYFFPSDLAALSTPLPLFKFFYCFGFESVLVYLFSVLVSGSHRLKVVGILLLAALSYIPLCQASKPIAHLIFMLIFACNGFFLYTVGSSIGSVTAQRYSLLAIARLISLTYIPVVVLWLCCAFEQLMHKSSFSLLIHFEDTVGSYWFLTILCLLMLAANSRLVAGECKLRSVKDCLLSVACSNFAILHTLLVSALALALLLLAINIGGIARVQYPLQQISHILTFADLSTIKKTEVILLINLVALLLSFLFFSITAYLGCLLAYLNQSDS